jgi:[ribosomal protein S5]-alanine N-acetyltransferase
MVVRGPKLSLRYGRPDDAHALFELASDPEVVRFFSWGPYRDPSEASAYLDSLERQRADGTRLELMIADEDDRPLGITGLSEFSLRDRRAVVGTWIGRQHWGTGVNDESKALILTLAFRAIGLGRVTAWASPENPRSIRALEKLGFEQEGVLANWHVHRGIPRDVAVLRMLREEFDRSPLARTPVAVEGEPPEQFVAAS